MKHALVGLVLVATVMAGPAFAQTSDPILSPAETVASPPAEEKSAVFTPSPAALKAAVQEQTVSQQEWQRQYDAAKARQRSGKKKIYIGLGMGLGGAVMMVVPLASSLKSDADCGESCSSNSTSAIAVIGIATAIGGGVTYWLGILDRAAANGSISALEKVKPAVAAAQTITLTDHQALRVSVGSRTSIGYRLAW